MTNLEVVDLCKSFGTQTVFRDLNLKVGAGTFTSILGPSGSGKTTLLRIVAGFERADGGTVRLGDSVVDDAARHLPPDQRHIGYVPQDGSLFPHLSVQDNVGFGASRRARRSGAVTELLAMVGLEGLGRRYPHQLSGGQQQRVALARALAVHPSIVLLDEPFSSLDASLRASVRQDVRRVLAEAGTTAVLVTHDQDEALSLSDRVAVIEDGRIGQYDTPAGLYTRPCSPGLARGLGQTNFLPGTARGGAVDTPLGALVLDRGAYQDGAEVLVLVRPEQLHLLPAPANGAVAARAMEREYYGHDAVVRVRAEWEPETTLTVRVVGARQLPEAGSRVGLAVRGPVVAWPAGQ